MAVIVIMPNARGIAALLSALLPVLVSRLSMGSQKCTDAADGSTCKGAYAKISCRSWQMGYNSARQNSPSRAPQGPLGIPLGPDLAVPAHLIFEGRQLLGANRTARMQLAGGDADFPAEAELAAVGELRRRVPKHDRAIHAVEEIFCGGGLFRDNRFGVTGAKLSDVPDRVVDVLHRLHREHRGQIFRAPVGVRRFSHRNYCARLGIAAQLAVVELTGDERQ